MEKTQNLVSLFFWSTLFLGWALFQWNICRTERSDNEEQFDRKSSRQYGRMIDCRGRRLNDKILKNLIKLINFLLMFVFNYQFTCNVNYISRYHIGQCSIKHVLHCVGMTKAYSWQSDKNIIQKTDQKKNSNANKQMHGYQYNNMYTFYIGTRWVEFHREIISFVR